jgi:signal transduction histidine kinase
MWRRVGVRARTTAIAVGAVAVVLTVAAIAIVTFIDRTLTDQVRDVALQRADELAGGAHPDAFTVGSDDEFVQSVGPDGSVSTSTSNLSSSRPVADLRTGEVVVDDVVAGEGPFLVVAQPQGASTLLVGRSLDDVVEATAAATASLAVVVPVVVLLVGILTWLLVGRALAPMDAMRAEADRISASELGRRLPDVGASDEVGRLADTLNGMLERLEAAQRRLRRFVSDASHELRSPIASIRQHAEVVRDEPGARDLTADILPELERLQNLIDDLLVLARLDEGASPRETEVDLDDLVLAEAARLRQRPGLHVDTTGIGPARTHGNAPELARVVRNLADNAGRHAASAVAFTVSSVDGIAELTVDDDGSGIRVDERNRVLERFVRLDEGRGRHQGGAGLGLAIASEVIAAHGGEIRLGTAPLGGLRVTVSLPGDPASVGSASTQARSGMMGSDGNGEERG